MYKVLALVHAVWFIWNLHRIHFSVYQTTPPSFVKIVCQIVLAPKFRDRCWSPPPRLSSQWTNAVANWRSNHFHTFQSSKQVSSKSSEKYTELWTHVSRSFGPVFDAVMVYLCVPFLVLTYVPPSLFYSSLLYENLYELIRVRNPPTARLQSMWSIGPDK